MEVRYRLIPSLSFHFLSLLIFCFHSRLHDASIRFDSFSLVKEHKEAKKKMNEVDDAKKTFLKIQIPKMEKQIKTLTVTVSELLEEEELDPRGEYFQLAKKLVA